MATEQICIPALPCPKCGFSMDMHKHNGKTQLERHFEDCDGDGDATRGLVELTLRKKANVVGSWDSDWKEHRGESNWGSDE